MEAQSVDKVVDVAGELLGKGIFLAVVIIIAYLVQRVLVRMLRRAFKSADLPNVSLWVNLLKVLIWVFALLVVLEPVFGIKPTAVVAALGVTSVAVSLGMQETISNVVAGFALTANHVIRQGDVISVGDVTGTITSLTLRQTVIHTFGGDDVVIPNSVLNSTSLTRLSDASASLTVVPIMVKPNADQAVVVADIRRKVGETLSDSLRPDLGCQAFYAQVDGLGVRVNIRLFLQSGVFPSVAADKALRAIAGSPWLVGVPGDATDGDEGRR